VITHHPEVLNSFCLDCVFVSFEEWDVHVVK